MAYPWARDFNPNFQVESRVKGRVLSTTLALAMIVSTSTALAATSKPTPKPSVKASAKAAAKATPKATKRPVVKKSSPKRKAVYTRKKVKVSPSPSPKWPPTTKGWTFNGEVYAKVPTNSELLGVLSAATALATAVKPCAKSACGAVEIASTKGCTWWEINSTVSGPLSATDKTIVPYGTLRTTAKATNKKQIITVLLISTEPLKQKVSVGGININCYHSPVAEKIPSNVYTQNTPAPTDSPTTNTN
jgi:hypothetical protein